MLSMITIGVACAAVWVISKPTLISITKPLAQATPPGGAQRYPVLWQIVGGGVVDAIGMTLCDVIHTDPCSFPSRDAALPGNEGKET